MNITIVIEDGDVDYRDLKTGTVFKFGDDHLIKTDLEFNGRTVAISLFDGGEHHTLKDTDLVKPVKEAKIIITE